MAKISKEEYEKLKRAKADGYEWVAKDMSGGVFAYKIKPEKYSYSWIDDNNYRIISSRGSELEVLRWNDEEPYSIAELIEGYEKESEETEVNKQKLIEKWESAIEAAEFYGKGKEEELISYMKDFVSDLNQLDEPEVLSQEWIDEHSNGPSRSQYVWVSDLKEPLVPKQELPVIPDYVEERIEKSKEDKLELGEVFSGVFTSLNLVTNPTEDLFWIRDNQELFARAWLDGFTVEEEPKYIVRFNRGTYKPVFIALDKISNHIHYVESHDYNKENLRVHLNEREIRALDDGDVLFEHFAVKAEELEE